MGVIADEIAAVDAQIAAKLAEIATLTQNEADWRRQSTVPCTGIGKKKAACEADKAFKLSRANSIVVEIQGHRATVKQLEDTKATLIAQQRAQNEATVNLSTQGISLSALEIQATGQAAAGLASAQTEADAKAAAIMKAAESKAQADKTKQMVLIIIAVVIGLIVAAVVIAKLKKSKKRK